MIFGTEKSLPLRGQNQINRSLASLCARICARMAGILLAYRESQRFLTKSSFFSRKTHRFRNEERCFEIDDFVILSLARLPISPPWRGLVYPSTTLVGYARMRRQRCNGNELETLSR